MITKLLWNKRFLLNLDSIKIAKHLHFENTFCIVINLDWIKKELEFSKTVHFHFNGNNNFELLNLNELYGNIISNENNNNNQYIVLQVEIEFEPTEIIFYNDSKIIICEKKLLNKKVSLIFDHNNHIFKGEISSVTSYNHNYVYATGSMKSGTTWIEEILNSSSQIVTMHEGNTLDAIKNIINSNLELSPEFNNRSYIKWLPIRNKINPNISGLLSGLLSRSILDFYMSLVGVKIGIDRTASSVNSVSSNVDFFRNTKIIHIIRNPFDVLISQIYHQLNLYKNTGFVDEIFSNINFQKLIKTIETNKYVIEDFLRDGVFDKFLIAWKVEQNLALQLAENSLVPIKIIRYEDLINFPKNSIQELFNFLNIEIDYHELNNIVDRSSFLSKTSGRYNGKEDINSFYRKGIIGDHKNYFINTPVNYVDKDFLRIYHIFYPN